MTLKKTAFTAHIERARTHIQQRARIRLKPCPLSDAILFYRTSVLYPLNDFGSAVPSFQLHPVFGAVSNRVPPGNAMSCFIGLGDKSWDNFKNFFQTQDIEFLFLSQRPRLAARIVKTILPYSFPLSAPNQVVRRLPVGVLMGAFYFQGISRSFMNAAIGRFMNERPA